MRFVLIASLSICVSFVRSTEPSGAAADNASAGDNDGGYATPVVPSPPKPTVQRTVPPPKRWNVPLSPRYELGAALVRGKKRVDPSLERKVLCPDDKEYCIDTRYSDRGTCMFPQPLAIKICLDETCASSPENAKIFQQFGEDSYCKDRQGVDGRVCQWIDHVPCSCSKFDIEYVDAIYIPNVELNPVGFKIAHDCKYPDNYKGENKREWVEPAPPKVAPNVLVAGTTTTKDGESMLITSATGLVVTLLSVAFMNM